MKLLWRVALYEYRRNVFKKSFILLLISVPVFIIFSVGLGVVLENSRDNSMPVGYIDQAKLFSAKQEINSKWLDENEGSIAFIAYPSEEVAKSALTDGEIQAYYLIPPDYSRNRRIEQIYLEKPGENIARDFYNFLQLNLLSEQPYEIAYRIAVGTDVTVRSIDGLRSIPSGGPTFGLLMPLFLTMGFLFMIMMSSGYTFTAVAEEKENRTMEVLVTSISPGRLITGKILGIVGIGLTLLFSWALEILIGIFVARLFGISWFSDLNMDWRIILSTIIIGIPTYALAIALMTAIGAMVPSTQEGQSVSSIFFILHLIPMYISWSFIKDPHSSIAVILSLTPFTALMTIGMRNLFSIVPVWQILISFCVQIIGSLGAFWLAGRSLRMGLLRYGQKLSWRNLLTYKLNRGKTNE